MVNNTATTCDVLCSDNSNVTINNTTFSNNKAKYVGGVLCTGSSSTLINKSFFYNNEGGCAALYAHTMSIVFIEDCSFLQNKANKGLSNGGGLCIRLRSKLFLSGQNKFVNNYAAMFGSAIHVLFGSIVSTGVLSITNNVATLESLALLHSYGHLTGTLTIENNKESLFVFDSDLSINGNFTLSNNTPVAGDTSTLLDIQEGGGMTTFLSNIIMNGSITIQDNSATNGGGILAAASKILMSGHVKVVRNIASDSGGGLYVYQSELKLHGLIQVNENMAVKQGGGIHAISSSVVMAILKNHSSSTLHFTSNIAERGGGICFEVSSKLYATGRRKPIYFTNNTADRGGAIYVADNTNIGTCKSKYSSSATEAFKSECFFQTVTVNSRVTLLEEVFAFSGNKARYSGAILFGGLIDRCTVKTFGKMNLKYVDQKGSPGALLNRISSNPVRV